jgi:hypothetical protein
LYFSDTLDAPASIRWRSVIDGQTETFYLSSSADSGHFFGEKVINNSDG